MKSSLVALCLASHLSPSLIRTPTFSLSRGGRSVSLPPAASLYRAVSLGFPRPLVLILTYARWQQFSLYYFFFIVPARLRGRVRLRSRRTKRVIILLLPEWSLRNAERFLRARDPFAPANFLHTRVVVFWQVY